MQHKEKRMKTTIKEIFQEEGYSIPNYQRDYA